jgi:hypothetical protein
MSFVWSVLLFVLGFFLATLVFSFVVLPLLYGLPRSIYHHMRGEIPLSVALGYLFPPLFWSILFFGIALLLVFFVPSASALLLSSGAFALGQFIGLGFMVLRCLTASGRADLRADFDAKVFGRYER